MSVLAFLGVLSLLSWLGVALHPARPWDFQPVGDDDAIPPPPPQWPQVTILVPARNESDSLPRTLPALLLQDYPGPFHVIVIDDRSDDGTAVVAKQIAAQVQASDRLTAIGGAPLPQGWVGKVWALEQGAAHCGLQTADDGSTESPRSSLLSGQSHALPPKYFLLTDADIHHAPCSLRRLVTESERSHLALNSRMARLRCLSAAERLLIPPFVFFFNLLYPMRQVNDRQSTLAAAAGGCVLLETADLRRAGGFACIKDRIIDDVSLARAVKGTDAPIQLALSRTEVESLRVYDALDTIWVMVRRTAFTELRYSWLRLGGTVVGMGLMFLLPPFLAVWGMMGWLFVTGNIGMMTASSSPLFLMLSGVSAWAVAAFVYRPAIRFFGLPPVRIWTLPLAGLLYGAMTVDSAWRYITGRRIGWRDH
ncbi:MAG: glycosyltransferase [Deltaproteobacteria bacterium]|nr:glycosyltransferase [Deltaproteobacteria bacterium]